jgi:hypothetical protein
LPKPSSKVTRVESIHKDYVACITHKSGSNEAGVEIYKRVDTGKGPGYIRVARDTADFNSHHGVFYRDPQDPNTMIAVSMEKGGQVSVCTPIGFDAGQFKNGVVYEGPFGKAQPVRYEDITRPEAHTEHYVSRDRQTVMVVTEDEKTHKRWIDGYTSSGDAGYAKFSSEELSVDEYKARAQDMSSDFVRIEDAGPHSSLLGGIGGRLAALKQEHAAMALTHTPPATSAAVAAPHPSLPVPARIRTGAQPGI